MPIMIHFELTFELGGDTKFDAFQMSIKKI